MLDIDSNPRSIQSMYSWFTEGKLIVDRRYQRKLVWTLEEKQKLIESILRRYPIPAILLAEREGGYEIIDGLQRLHTLMSFVETSFPTLDGNFFDVSKFPTAKLHADDKRFVINPSPDLISTSEVGSFLDYSLPISVMRGATEADINDVFGRINTYGHRLSDQERRQAGVQGEFSNLVREVSSELRGDSSKTVLALEQMPSISIDLPMNKHGYSVAAENVFWVKQGILRSTDLRDSMDEQCVADILANIVGAQPIARSREALDKIYTHGSTENNRISAALSVHGGDRLRDEIKFLFAEILEICNHGSPIKLKDLIFSSPTNNSFPAVFANLMIALNESLIVDKKRISDYEEVKNSLRGLSDNIVTGKGAVTSDKRRKNINAIKGIISQHLIDDDLKRVYGNHSIIDLENIIRRSEIELPNIEFKQGALSLGVKRSLEDDVFEKVIKTAAAIANIGPKTSGSIIIGVSDKPSDTARIKTVDGISPRLVGRKEVVGIAREASYLEEKNETYFNRWRDKISTSSLSDPLKSDILSNIDFHDYFGLGLIVISIPPQTDLSYYGDEVYWREGDQTKQAKTPKKIAELAKRF